MKYRTKSLLAHVLAIALLGSVTLVHAKQGGQSNNSAKQYAPGQQKQNAGTKGSAKLYAPGQLKKNAGTKGSAKQYAPGQQKRNLSN